MKKPYNLEERTLEFAKGIVNLCSILPQNAVNFKLISQLVGASGSVGANYREANEKLSKKDFLHRMKSTRKECKESSYWLELVKETNQKFTYEIEGFIKESQELRNIFSCIISRVG